MVKNLLMLATILVCGTVNAHADNEGYRTQTEQRGR